MTNVISHSKEPNLFNNLSVRILLQAIPYVGAGIDLLLQKGIEEFEKERMATFLQSITEGSLASTEADLKSEPYLHNFILTVNVVLKTRRREKIALVGALFSKAVKKGFLTLPESDKYETYLKILDELTLEEINILKLLNDFEIKNEAKDTSRRERLLQNIKFWPEFEKDMLEKLSVTNASLDGVLIRIERTGCLYIPRKNANDLSGYAAITTDVFHEFQAMILA